MELKNGDLVVITEGEKKGTLARYVGPYPYPEGDPINPKSILRIEISSWTVGRERVIVNDNMFIPVVEPAMEEKKKETSPLPLKSPKFSISDQVLVKFGDYRGVFSTVQEVLPIQGGRIYDYVIGPFSTRGVDINIQVPEEYIESKDSVDPEYTINGFDVSKYLDLNQMKRIVTEIYRENVTAHVKEIIKNRSFGGTTILDFCLGEVAKQIVQEMSSSIKTELEDHVKYVMNRTSSDQDEYTFDRMILGSLDSVARWYVDSHKEELEPILKERMKDAVDKLSIDRLVTMVERKIDLKSVLKEVLEK